MNQAADQVMYLGRWVSKNNFRVMVYNKLNEQKLVNSHDEFTKVLASNEWFAEKPSTVLIVKEKEKAPRKAKNGSVN